MPQVSDISPVHSLAVENLELIAKVVINSGEGWQLVLVKLAGSASYTPKTVPLTAYVVVELAQTIMEANII